MNGQKFMKLINRLFALTALAMTLAMATWAQATHTYVATTGADTNPCSRTEPCRTINAAIEQVIKGGEVIILDSGAFDQATINKSLTMSAAPGVHASIGVTRGSAIAIAVGVHETVVLRNLFLRTASSDAVNGLTFVGGYDSHLAIDNCQVEGFKGIGISFEPTAFGHMVVRNTVVRDCFKGIRIGQSEASALIEDTRVEENSHIGIEVQAGDTVILSRTTSIRNLHGVNNKARKLHIEGCTIAQNGVGVASSGPLSETYISGSHISSSMNAITRSNGAQIHSRGNNSITGGAMLDSVLPLK